MGADVLFRFSGPEDLPKVTFEWALKKENEPVLRLSVKTVSTRALAKAKTLRGMCLAVQRTRKEVKCGWRTVGRTTVRGWGQKKEPVIQLCQALRPVWKAHVVGLLSIWKNRYIYSPCFTIQMMLQFRSSLYLIVPLNLTKQLLHFFLHKTHCQGLWANVG